MTIPLARINPGTSDADMTSLSMLNDGLTQLNSESGRVNRLTAYWRNQQPSAFLSTDAAKSLDNRVKRLSVNYTRLAVSSLADRIKISGITSIDDTETADAVGLWRTLQTAGISTVSNMVTVDRLLYGCAYLTVWAPNGHIVMTADAPTNMTHVVNPTTQETLYAVRAWSDNSRSYAALYTSDVIIIYTHDGTAWTPSPGWMATSVIDNPLGVVPVIPFVRKVSANDDDTGASSPSDILDLSDAVSKLLGDAMVTSEYYARPRRWATGLEIIEDEEGNPLDPFGDNRFLQSEAPETKFGQLDSARLDGYSSLIATITQQIGSLTGLPPHYLGIHGDQPTSAESVKAAEAQLTMRAYDEQASMQAAWSEAIWIAEAIENSVPVNYDRRRNWSIVWASPEIRTQAQASDAAAKLRGIGVPLEAVLRDPMGYPPDKARAIAQSETA